MFRGLSEAAPGDPGLGHWQLQGRWEVVSGELVHLGDSAPATAVVGVQAPESFLFEVNGAGAQRRPRRTGPDLRRPGVLPRQGQLHGGGPMQPEAGLLCWRTYEAGELAWSGDLTRLRPDFRAEAYHQLLLRREGPTVSVKLDGVSVGPVPVDVSTGAVG